MYLDFQATTPMDPRVLDKMVPFMLSDYGNPHSKTHQYGWDAEKSIENARNEIASLISASGREIVFTSGATEANNLALNGYEKKIISSIEHDSISNQKNIIEVDAKKLFKKEKKGINKISNIAEVIENNRKISFLFGFIILFHK